MPFIPKKTSTDLKQNLLPGNLVVAKLLISLYMCETIFFTFIVHDSYMLTCTWANTRLKCKQSVGPFF